MSSLSTLPKGDSAWLLRKSIQRIMQQVSVLETNIGSSTTGNSADTQVIFNDAGTLRGDTGLTYDKSADRLSFGAGICYGLLTSASATITGPVVCNGAVTLGDAVGDAITANGSFTSYTGQVPSAIRAAASDYAAVDFDGATSGTRITSTLTGQNIGTGDFSLWSRFRVPASVNAANRGLIALTSNATSTVQAESAHLFISSNAGELVFRLYGATASDVRQATINVFLSAYTGQVVDVVVTRTGTTLKIFINGTDTAYIEGTSGTAPAWSATVTSTFCNVGMAVGTSLFNSRIYRSVVFNRALSASDVTELITTGVNPADQWGTQTAAYTSDFSAGTDGWSAVRGTADGNIDGISGVDNTLRFTVDSTASNTHYLQKTPFSGVLAGKRYRVGFNYFITASNATITGIALWQIIPGTQISTIQSVLGAWTSIAPVEFVSVANRIDVLTYAGTNTTFTGNGTDTFYLHSFVVTRIGAIVDLDFTVGGGSTAYDRSTNGLDGTLFGGVSWTMPREGQYINGPSTITGDLTVGTGAFGAGQSGGLIGNGKQVVFTNNSGSNSGWISNADNACIYSSGAGGAFAFNGHLVLQPRGSAAGAILFGTGNGAAAMAERYRIASDGVATWSNVGGVAGTAMTLNATGLGVGASPSYKLDIAGSGRFTNNIYVPSNVTYKVGPLSATWSGLRFDSANAMFLDSDTSILFRVNGGTSFLTAATIDSSGNVGIGVTPSAWATTFQSYKALEIGAKGNALWSSGASSLSVVSNAYFDSADTRWEYANIGLAARYYQDDGLHKWYTAASGAAGAEITDFATAKMTLDASGRLILLASTTTPATLSTNGQLTFTATSDTNLRFSYRGSDGVTRTADLTLA